MTAKDTIQQAQTTLGQLRMTYRDSQPEFWALAVAWEAVRFAWYVTDGDLGTAQDKLALIKEAIADFERMASRLPQKADTE
jgi:hypothetical protein